MNQLSPTEIANRAIADAVVTAVREDPTASAQTLSDLAVNVATALMAGFSAISPSASLAAPSRPAGI